MALALVAVVAPALAQVRPAPADQPLPQERISTPTTGLVTIESDQQRADNRTGVITATGNVRIVYPDQRVVATARQAQYFSQEGRVILSGDVDIVQTDGHAMRAERVVVDLNSERLVAEPVSGSQVLSTVRIPRPQASPRSGSGGSGTAASTPLPPAAGKQP